MITRIQIKGFKNLQSVDVRFGPFTCIAGPNGVGKSNFFDAIRFLSALADQTLLEAAKSVRDETGKSTDPKSLFYNSKSEEVRRISFDVEMIVSKNAIDDLGVVASARVTFLNYKLVIGYDDKNRTNHSGGLEIIQEELKYMKEAKLHAKTTVPFLPAPTGASKEWLNSAILGTKTSPFISTSDNKINLHQEGTKGGPRRVAAKTLRKTVLSSANSSESPTATAARNELRSWRLLQLEPSALRKPDEVTAPQHISDKGGHMASTLYRLAHSERNTNAIRREIETSAFFQEITNRLSGFLEDLAEVGVDYDEVRGLFTLFVTDRKGNRYPARALSDGTLRFIALSILQLDTSEGGVICLEEPENGIHPKRISAMLQLLRDICTDVSHQVGVDNPLRQVLINTHSPLVVAHVNPQDLLFVDTVTSSGGANPVRIRYMEKTWRDNLNLQKTNHIGYGEIISYLGLVDNQGEPFPGSVFETAMEQLELPLVIKNES